MSLKVIADLDAERLPRSLPPWLRGRLVHPPAAERITLALFGDKEIVTSGAVARLRRKLADASDHLVVGAKGFTQEAEHSLLAQGATLVSAGEFPWTDASYAAVHRRGSG